MVTPDDRPLPPPLPVRVRPAAGETAESYIRRLAQANHLRPSLLQVYVRNPDVGLPCQFQYSDCDCREGRQRLPGQDRDSISG